MTKNKRKTLAHKRRKMRTTRQGSKKDLTRTSEGVKTDAGGNPTLRIELSEAQSAPMLTHGFLRREIIEMRPSSISGRTRPSNRPGLYTVEFTFQPPARVIPDEAAYNAEPDAPGDSLMDIRSVWGPDVGDFTIDMGHRSPTDAEASQKYTFYCNDSGYLASVRTTLRADDSGQAGHLAWQHLAPLLSAWTFAHDVPLDVVRIRTEEAASGTLVNTYFRQPYRRVDAQKRHIENLAITQNYHVLVFYREALSASSPHYQYLCFYKVIQFVQRQRSEEVQRAKALGHKPQVVSERFLDADWALLDIDDEALRSAIVNQTFNYISTNVLRPVRNRISHCLLDAESTSDSDAEALLDTENVYQLLPVVKYIARRMVATQMGISL